MANYLVDSDVLIWVLRNRTETVDLLARLVKESGEALACSALSILEIGAGAKPSESQKTRLFLESFETIPVDRPVAQLAGDLLRLSRHQNNPREWVDALIAATALQHHLPLLTYNRKDYPYRGLTLYPI